jgi:predicted DCC family thiol-disulfide oxidoreductase YuxK
MAISVHTEATDERGAASRGRTFYDADCPGCLAWVGRLRPILGSRGFDFVPLQAPGVRGLLRLGKGRLLSEMRVLLPSGESFGGADAIIELAKYVWWAWPLVALAQIPGMRRALRAAYRGRAARRECLTGKCGFAASPSEADREPIE